MNSFQGSERLIFEYIQCHAHEISGISAKVIASETFTTTTSVNRVCKKMGYRSYTELRYQFSRDRLIAEPVRYVVGDEKEETVTQLCNILVNSSHIFLYARGASLTSLNYLSRFLSLASLPHLILNDVHQLTRVSKGTLVLISKSGETASLVEMARNALRKGLKIIAITKRESTLATISTLCWPLDIDIDAISLYQREGQLELLTVVDRIGCYLLQYDAA
ncbi:TPA: MurR/RpiR family transcriptional regulator [Citrobacter koseri]|uniref:MurR/RpiR family transcriptional regulator n=1 Tax=Citrobacter TaxID=544 RepID=UPI000537E5F9|nr:MULTISPECIES: MurR/RpiR family transcriptional regulator [Citrobacter]AYY72920.1 MurR/RpiR family transcriptional regulator [Citrobacter koseri]EKX8767131.1 MurR/RpiR family transcriptional regulator [Citrobacter koseri]ELJ2665430.1 MurR/RpiR family transcriptional regulator [Citrobacter koseri]MBJ8806320.1 MurR/RpiR family transcriptional regulator [Citrobacter koseri]MBJ8935818.1 MurR/RpiR family transcriptional regulator [Citrobacter koseri]